jgi:replicative DNA helicase
MAEHLETITVRVIDEPANSNIAAEAALLGALMIDNRAIERIADIVADGDFAEPMHGRIYSAILHEHYLGHLANPVTLRPFFADDDALKSLGGPSYLAQLTGSGAALIGHMDFARQVAELGKRRRLADTLAQVSKLCGDYEQPLDAIAGLAETAIADSIGTQNGAVAMSAAKAIEANIDSQFADAPGVVCGIIPSLDYALGAICPGDLAILAGRPGMCKTALALSYSRGVAEAGDGVTFLSLEMRAAQLGGRLACDVLFNTPDQVPYSAVSRNRCTVEQRRSLARASLQIRDWPLWIEDLPGSTLGRAAAIVRKHKRRLAARGKTLKLVVVDYLQLLSPDRPAKNLYEATSMVSRGLKMLAKAEDVGVLALCQLSRNVEGRDDKRPRLSDLRDSGQIEQDADSICFLVRMEEYLRREEPDQNSDKWITWHNHLDRERGKIEFIIAKLRAGVTSNAQGLWP